jgi:dUTP pyrophosphatase
MEISWLDTVKCEHSSISFELIYDTRYKPRKGTVRSAGLDVASTMDIVVPPQEHRMIPLTLSWEVTRVKYGYTAFVSMVPRSGLAKNLRVSLTNSPGIIDQDYKGEWCANVLNLGDNDFEIFAGDYIAQCIIHVVPDIPELNVFCTGATRGTGGFGSTGR